MKLRTVTSEQLLALNKARVCLRDALKAAKDGGATRVQARIRAAQRSLGGAIRHAERADLH